MFLHDVASQIGYAPVKITLLRISREKFPRRDRYVAFPLGILLVHLPIYLLAAGHEQDDGE